MGLPSCGVRLAEVWIGEFVVVDEAIVAGGEEAVAPQSYPGDLKF